MGDPGRPSGRESVPEDLDGVRADRVVSVVFSLPRGAARTIIDAGEVTVSGTAVSAKQRLAVGDVIEALLPAADTGLVPHAVPFEVRYEDAALLVVDKPAGVVVHPGSGTSAPTLVAGLVHRFPELAALDANRWGLVHRLDRDTSGLLAVARSAEVHATLQQALRRREIGRRYLALVVGLPDGVRGTVDAPMGRDPHHPTRQAVMTDGRPARTHFRRLAEWGTVSLLEVTLETGRTHQIRVHLASIGNPVVGDGVYAGRRGAQAMALLQEIDPGRQWLHAHALELDHPVDRTRLLVEAPLPPDLVASLATLGTPHSGDLGSLAPGGSPVVDPER